MPAEDYTSAECRPWRAGEDEAVYIAFNPAYRLPSLPPEEAEMQLTKIQGWSANNPPPDMIERIFSRTPKVARELQALGVMGDALAKLDRELVGWSALQAAIGIADVHQFAAVFEAALFFRGLPDVPVEAEVLWAHARDERLYFPEDQRIQPAMEIAIGEAFRNAGCHVLKMSDVVMSYELDLTVDDLLNASTSIANDRRAAAPPAAIWCEDVGMACYVGFDSATTVFRGSMAAMRASQLPCLLEGQWASASDEPVWDYWWLAGLWPDASRPHEKS